MFARTFVRELYEPIRKQADVRFDSRRIFMDGRLTGRQKRASENGKPNTLSGAPDGTTRLIVLLADPFMS